MRRSVFAVLVALAAGCSGGDGTSGGVAGTELLSRLGGLWSGSASQTPLGTFPVLNMDLRAADPHTLFSRADLDSQNNLRFAFAIETHGTSDVLVFRNGGYFQGILRDTRTALVDSTADRFHFCSINGDGSSGCDYLDAVWTLQAADRLELDVKVRGQQHMLWPAQRLETRQLPQPFPVDNSPVGSGDSPFPPMPTLSIDVTFDAPLLADADVWVLLSQNGCSTSGCSTSRSIMAPAAAGSSHAVLTIEQLHAGDYQAMALIDRGRTFATTLHPSRGDGVTWPLNKALSVASQGTTQQSLRIGFNVP